MSTRHDVHLARQIAAEIEGSCRGTRVWWARHEAQLATATTPAEAEGATRAPIEICGTCPAYDLCEQWAQLDDYTGIAAGAVYINGRRRKPSTILLKATPPRPPDAA